MTNQATRGKLKTGHVTIPDAGNITVGNVGGYMVRTIAFNLDYDDFTTAGGAVGTATLSTLIPAGARYLDTLITSVTGFTGNVSAGLTIGDGSDPDRYHSAGTLDVFTTAAAGIDAGTPSGDRFHTAAGTPTFIANGSSSYGSVTAGNVQGYLLFF